MIVAKLLLTNIALKCLDSLLVSLSQLWYDVLPVSSLDVVDHIVQTHLLMGDQCGVVLGAELCVDINLIDCPHHTPVLLHHPRSQSC